MQPRDYGPFPYVPIKDRPKLEWPGGARLAVWVIPNIEFFPLTRGIAGQPGAPPGNPPSVRAWAQRDYGNRVGIWRLMDVLSKHGIRASPTLNSDICDHHPQIVRAGDRARLGDPRPQPDQQRVARHARPRGGTPDDCPHALAHRRDDRQEAASAGSAPVSPRPGTRSTSSPRRAVCTSPTGSMTTSLIRWISAASGWSRSPIPTRSTTRRTSTTATARSTNSKR